MAIKDLFNQPLQVINTGLASFRNNIESSGAKVIQVSWKPSVDVKKEDAFKDMFML